MGERRPEAILHALQQWAATIPPTEATTQIDELKYEWVFLVTPVRQGASALELRVAKTAPICDVGAGRRAQWSDLPCSPRLALDIAQAVRAGLLKEQFWEMGGVTLQAKAQLPVRDDVLHTRFVNPLYFVWRVIKRTPPRTVDYLPYGP